METSKKMAQERTSLATTIQGTLWGLFAISIWAGWMVATRFDLDQSGLTVADLTAIRFGTAAVILLPVLFRNGLVAPGTGVVTTVLLMAGAGAPYVLVASAGLLFAPSSQAGALIPGTMPLWATILSYFLLKERISRPRVFGLALIPLGIVLILGPDALTAGDGRWCGQLLFLLASCMWATYTVTMRRGNVKPMHGAAIVSFWSACLFLPIYFFGNLPSGIAGTSLHTIVFEMIFQGALTSVISLIAFNRAVTILGASRATILAALIPAQATLLAVFFLGETLTTPEIGGIVSISLGVLFGSGAITAILQRRGERGARVPT